MTQIASWNVNGLRAVHRKGNLFEFLEKENVDILCLQETKAHKEQLPDEIRSISGYTSYFCSPKERKGYSGVAVYTKDKPLKVECGMGVEELDKEGRLLTMHHEEFILINIYFPNGGGGPERLKYKLNFYDAFLIYVEKLRNQTEGDKKIIFCGDVNTAHEEIDLARPKENKKNSGFLPEERAWLDEVVASGFIDVFRHFYSNKADSYTYWDMKTRARDRNVGWRIDYFFANTQAIKNIKDIRILKDIYGSDHCPLVIKMS